MHISIKLSIRHTLFLSTFCMLLNIQSSFAQFGKFPLKSHGTSVQTSRGYESSGRKKADVLKLPFWDDFSSPNTLSKNSNNQFYPDTIRWTNSYSVWVNNGMAINQPTINSATFDGLDSAGRAYDAQQVLVTGFNDSLTSQPIDLSENSVPLANRDSVYLSFFYQWQGNGEAPDQDDYLQLEFRDTTGWQPVLKISPKPDFDRTIFYDTIIKVSDVRYFHDAFQFRFRNFGRQSGPYDTWNIDYVYLNDNRTVNDNSFPDRAAASDLSPIFGSFTAIPYDHFSAGDFLDTISFDVQNLKNAQNSVGFEITGTFLNLMPDSTVSKRTGTLLPERGVKITSGQMNPLERVTVREDSLLANAITNGYFDTTALSVDVEMKINVISDDAGDSTLLKRFDYIDFRINDTITSIFELGNYYAYDDGVAEYTAGLIEPGNLVAYRFDMLVPRDTLIGFAMYFPSYGITPNQTISFFIYHDNNGKPGDVWASFPARRIEQKGLNEFQTMLFIPAELIDESRFYIGWRQPIEGKALIGLDIDNDTGDRIYVNTGTEWYQNQDVRGSLMIRPLFGKGQLADDPNVGIEDELQLSVYPNPSNGSFYIQGYYDDLRIYRITGEEVSYESEKKDQLTAIHVNKHSGLYFLRITKNNQTITHKVVISR